ncbi:YqgE/AlgH family protein [Sphingobacterium rhinopitheci]|uniref:YqgE/AlgH family protein n=1 Tax=Sphingobacterium rhinopitheci TaxID=2781960 RepID=UPI001F51DE44|nr:YqgE/AlgH family protein [Sphingobacterium rhinopitheci]MCI0921408.1 YqgE/AlgH family protein [Sphingobacterium rhinopitheci]
MFNKNKPIQGSLLLAEPFMLDKTFERSVVFLCDHNSDGTFGFILNNRTILNLADIISNMDNIDFPIFMGGPVEPTNLFYIHRAYDKMQSGELITKDVYLGGDFKQLLFLIQEKLITTDEVKIFIGYCGWSENQLMEEINQNSWAVHPSFDTSLLFIDDGENLWKQALIDLGPKFAHIANFPKSPNLN